MADEPVNPALVRFEDSKRYLRPYREPENGQEKVYVDLEVDHDGQNSTKKERDEWIKWKNKASWTGEQDT